MQKLTFVIGAPATGKTHFINQNYANKDVDVLDIYDYQQKAYDRLDLEQCSLLEKKFRCLLRANEMQLQDIIEKLKQGRNVVAEQTFFKAKRRITYVDEIRKALNEEIVEIEVFVMHPSDEQWAENIKKRNLSEEIQYFKKQAEDMEFPNPIEGFDAIYEVSDEKGIFRMDPPMPEILARARRELAKEEEQLKKEDSGRNA